MAITRYTGPLLVPGALGAMGSGDSNSTPGPSCFVHGVGLVDQRYMQSGGEVSTQFPVWFGAGTDVCVVDQAPSTISAINLVAAAAPTTGVAMTLAAASTGITVVGAGGFQIAPGYPTVPAGCLCIDGLPALINLGTQSGGITMFDPRTAATRAIRITSAGNDSATGVGTLVGYDYYGQKMTQALALPNATVTTTTKAFKFLQSFTPSGTLSGSNISVGTSDVYGFNLACWEWGFARVNWAGANITANTGFVAAVATTPSASTGDVRGTYLVQSTASDGTRKLQAFVTSQAWNLTAVGQYGAVQA